MKHTRINIAGSIHIISMFVVLAALVAVGSGCSDHTDYRLGVVTRSVSGKLSVSGTQEEVQPFIIVRKYNKTLIESSSGYLYRISADVIFPVNGNYTVDMAAEVDRVELMFMGRYYTPVTHHFRRTLGVGEYIYNASLNKDPAWRDSYFLLIKPILTDYIVEQRFKMSHSDQLFLGQWMDRTESEF